VNVLFLDQFNVLGGAQQCLLDLLPAIAERGWSARIAIPPNGPLVETLRSSGMCADSIPCGPYGCGAKSAADILRFAADIPKQIQTISTLIDRTATDLIYVNGPRLLTGATLAAKGRVPIFFHAHNVVNQRSAAYVEGLALRRSKATAAACSDAVAKPLRTWLPSEQIHTIPNGTADLGFGERGAGLREPRIGVIGRIAPEKGQTEFLRAAAILTSKFPNARFVICGAPLFGDHNYYDEVLRFASGLPVEFLDWQKDIAVVLRNLDVLVIPSKQEGMPRVLLEAFSAGVPVVAFPVGGIPEVIDDGITGFLAQGPSPDELAGALCTVLESDPQNLRTVANNARRKWETNYTLAVYRERITNLMEQCVQSAGHEIGAVSSRERLSVPESDVRTIEPR
jgi:glycosyltransferase involved in cell wall biosynthesis